MRNLRQPLQVTCYWIVVTALTLAVMLPGLNGGFLFDDYPNIVENKAVQIDTLSLASLKASTSGLTAGPLGRPVSILSFALTHYYFGLNPFAFKAINLIIHLINGLLVAWLVTLMLRTLRKESQPDKGAFWLPFWVAAIWMVHPINVLPIMLSVQRMTLLAGMFTLLALISHLKALAIPGRGYKKWLWLGAGWLMFWPLSIWSKESGLLFPLFVLVTTFVLPSPGIAHGRKQAWIVSAALLALAAIATAMITYLGSGWLDGAYAMRPFTLAERLMTEARVLWFYAAQIIVPNQAAFGLYLDDFTLSSSILTPITTLPAIIGWGVVAAAIVYWRRQQPILCFAGAWFLAGHALESSILPLEIAHEYRNYLPSIGLIFGVAYLGLTLLPRLKLHRRPLLYGATIAAPIIALALMTLMRASQLGNPLLGPQLEAMRHSESARANYAAGLALIKAGYGDANDAANGRQIQFHLQQSGQADPTFKYGDLGLIAWACASGRTVEKQWLDNFENRLQYTHFSPRDRMDVS